MFLCNVCTSICVSSITVFRTISLYYLVVLFFFLLFTGSLTFVLGAHSIPVFMMTSPKRKYSGGKIALHSGSPGKGILGRCRRGSDGNDHNSSVRESHAKSNGRASRGATVPSENAFNGSKSSSYSLPNYGRTCNPFHHTGGCAAQQGS